MGLIRINRPSFIIYGGSITPGKYQNKDVDIVNAFQSYGELQNNKITNQEREELLHDMLSRKWCLWRHVYSKHYGNCY